jgi:thioredoxin 1
MNISQLTDRDFSRTVLESDEPVLVAFRAAWCQPSQELSPIIESVAQENEGRVRVVAVDVDDAAAVCQRFNVSRLPVTMLFEGGRVRDFIGGATSKEMVTDMLDRRLQPVREVNEWDFDREVLESRVPVLVHFGAAWCDANRFVAPEVDSLASKMAGRVRAVRVEFGPDTARLCARFGVTRVPTVALFVDGKVVDQIFGAMQGGTKAAGARTSCVGLTSLDNLEQMVEPFVA